MTDIERIITFGQRMQMASVNNTPIIETTCLLAEITIPQRLHQT